MGDRAAERYLEFFAVSISNENTRSVNPAQVTTPTLLTVPLPDVCYLTSLGAFSWVQFCDRRRWAHAELSERSEITNG
jgi:hypothetical protein